MREKELMEINYLKQLKAIKKWGKKLEIWRIKNKLTKREKNERSKQFIHKLNNKKKNIIIICEKKEKINKESKSANFNIKLKFKSMLKGVCNLRKRICNLGQSIKSIKGYYIWRLKFERYRWRCKHYILKCKWLGCILKVKYFYYILKLFFVNCKWNLIIAYFYLKQAYKKFDLIWTCFTLMLYKKRKIKKKNKKKK